MSAGDREESMGWEGTGPHAMGSQGRAVWEQCCQHFCALAVGVGASGTGRDVLQRPRLKTASLTLKAAPSTSGIRELRRAR